METSTKGLVKDWIPKRGVGSWKTWGCTNKEGCVYSVVILGQLLCFPPNPSVWLTCRNNKRIEGKKNDGSSV